MVLGLSPPLGELLKNFSDTNTYLLDICTKNEDNNNTLNGCTYNNTTTSINLISGNLDIVKNTGIFPTKSDSSGFSTKSVKSCNPENQNKFDSVSSQSIKKNFSAPGVYSRPRLKSAVRSSADRELDNVTGKPNLISRKMSEKVLR